MMTCTACKAQIKPDERYAVLRVSGGAELPYCYKALCLAKMDAAKGRLSGGVKRKEAAKC